MRPCLNFRSLSLMVWLTVACLALCLGLELVGLSDGGNGNSTSLSNSIWSARIGSASNSCLEMFLLCLTSLLASMDACVTSWKVLTMFVSNRWLILVIKVDLYGGASHLKSRRKRRASGQWDGPQFSSYIQSVTISRLVRLRYSIWCFFTCAFKSHWREKTSPSHSLHK